LNYPFSRGYIHATSSTDVKAKPDFDAGFLSQEADIAPQVWAYKKIREIVRRMPSFGGELETTHPRFPTKSAAACISYYDPDISDIEYSEEDDKAIEKWVREKVETSWHSSYTSLPFCLIVIGEPLR
jgi:alcohol oxidase